MRKKREGNGRMIDIKEEKIERKKKRTRERERQRE